MATFRDVIGYYRPYWFVGVLSVTASGIFEVMDLAVPYAIGQIANLLSGQPLDAALQTAIATVASFADLPVTQGFRITILAAIVFLLTVARAPIQLWVGDWFHWDIALKSRRDRNQQAIAKILTLPLGFYENNNPGRIAGRVERGINNYTWMYPEITAILLPKLIRIAVIFAIIWFVKPPIAWGFLVSFAVILSVTVAYLKRVVKRETKLDNYISNTESRTSELITNIKTVKAFGAEPREFQHQKRRLDRQYQIAVRRIVRNYITLASWRTTAVQLCVFGILVSGLIETLRGDISLGHFITTITVANLAYAELDPITDVAEMMARRYASMAKLQDFFKTPSGTDAARLYPHPTTDLDRDRPRFSGKIDFRYVTFGYDRDRPILQDINLLIEPYQTVALVGRSGSGKSTLVKLLFRYFDPDRGRILIDGTDIRSLDICDYRRRLAIVHQEVDIFNGTILDNLRYGNPAVSFDRIQEACRIAKADDIIAQLPDGYQTVVGERGVRLSGGQRQRLGIARSLVIDPDVLVFDEATSSLDYESERSIQLAMRSVLGTRTTLIIAHRLSTVREADKIVVMEKGTIAEVGNHAQLLDRGGIYHRLHSLSETGDLH